MLLSSCRLGAENNEILFRPRERRDATALLCMFNQPQCSLGMVSSPFPSINELESWLQSNGSGSYESVATIDDTAISLAGLYPCLASQSHSAWVCLFVHDEFAGHGIGTRMIMGLIATAHISGLTRIQLNVVCGNQRAINLYRKFGFEIEGRHRHFARRGDEFLDVFTMARITNCRS
jgi:L-phenylalanine/L-methionine N-acetyltransferase